MYKRLVCYFKGHVVSEQSVNDRGDFICERCGKLLSMRELEDLDIYPHRNIQCPHCNHWVPLTRNKDLAAPAMVYKYEDRADEVVEESKQQHAKKKDKPAPYIS